MGYGALAHDAGFELGQTLLISASFYALPAQVIFVDQMARGASLAAAAFAVTLTAVRLLPMTVSMMPYLRDPELPRCVVFPIAHFMAVTSWIEGNRVLPGLAVAVMACGGGESNVVNQYFTALNANDTNTLTSFAAVSFDKTVDDWKLVSVSDETRGPAPLPSLVSKQQELEAALAQNLKDYRAWGNDLEVYPKLDRVKGLREAVYAS